MKTEDIKLATLCWKILQFGLDMHNFIICLNRVDEAKICYIYRESCDNLVVLPLNELLRPDEFMLLRIDKPLIDKFVFCPDSIKNH